MNNKKKESLNITKLEQNHFKDLSQKKETPPPPEPKASIDKTSIEDYLKPNINSIVISNYNVKTSKQELYYILHLNREKVELIEKTENRRTLTIFDLNSNEITLNKKEMGKTYHKALQSRIKKIIKDCKDKKAFVYEEKK